MKHRSRKIWNFNLPLTMDVQLIHPLFDDELYRKQAFLVENQVLRIKSKLIEEERF
jgi:hypothetical protein